MWYRALSRCDAIFCYSTLQKVQFVGINLMKSTFCRNIFGKKYNLSKCFWWRTICWENFFGKFIFVKLSFVKMSRDPFDDCSIPYYSFISIFVSFNSAVNSAMWKLLFFSSINLNTINTNYSVFNVSHKKSPTVQL